MEITKSDSNTFSNKIIAGNWKMNLSIAESLNLTDSLVGLSNNLKKTDIFVAPSFTLLPQVAKEIAGSNIKLGAQNVHWEDSGAFTGEVSPKMLLELDCIFSLVGHSERRHIFGETNELVIKRALGALQKGLSIIFCVGETLQEKNSNITEKVINTQICSLFDELKKVNYEQLDIQDKVIIAYEPVWCIGTGQVASTEAIYNVHAYIQSLIFSYKYSCRILYGGSVNSDNAKQILELSNVNGALVGGASLNFEKI